MTMRTGPVNRRAVAEVAGAASVERQVAAGARRIRAEARQLAPVLTGTLRSSIIVEETRNPATNQTEYRVGWDTSIADYGPAVEFGTEDTYPRPHLRPAAYIIGSIKVGGL